jgi:hypothetical protein
LSKAKEIELHIGKNVRLVLYKALNIFKGPTKIPKIFQITNKRKPFLLGSTQHRWNITGCGTVAKSTVLPF